MKQRPKGGSSAKSTQSRATASTSSSETNSGKKNDVKLPNDVNIVPFEAKRSALALFTLCVLLVNGAWGVYHYQFENLPAPLTLDQAGKRGFSEHEAMKHVEALTRLGPHPVGSDALQRALKVLVVIQSSVCFL